MARRFVCVALLLLAAAAAACADAPPRPVILVVVDTLRPDHLGMYGYERPTSPGLDAWAEQGQVFDRAYSSSSWTLPAFATMFTSQYPVRHGAGTMLTSGPRAADDVRGRERFTGLDTAFPTLAEVFGAAGYRTGAVLSNPFLHENFGVSRGFQDYDYAARRRADEIVDRSLDWIAAREGAPFFLMVHFMDPHLPYDAPAPLRGRFTAETSSALEYPVARVHDVRRQMAEFSDADRQFVAAAYDEEIAYLDSEVVRLFESLQSRGVWENAIVLLTSDHGEELFEHGGFEHGHSFYDEVVRIPFLLWGAGTGRRPEPVSLLDVGPTLLAAAGVALPEGLQGLSVLEAGAEGIAAERGLVGEGTLDHRDLRAVVLWPYKILFEDDQAIAAFNLENDPAESVDLLGSADTALEGLVTAAARLLESPSGSLNEATLDPSVLEQLRDIGYIQ